MYHNDLNIYFFRLIVRKCCSRHFGEEGGNDVGSCRNYRLNILLMVIFLYVQYTFKKETKLFVPAADIRVPCAKWSLHVNGRYNRWRGDRSTTTTTSRSTFYAICKEPLHKHVQDIIHICKSICSKGKQKIWFTQGLYASFAKASK